MEIMSQLMAEQASTSPLGFSQPQHGPPDPPPSPSHHGTNEDSSNDDFFP